MPPRKRNKAKGKRKPNSNPGPAPAAAAAAAAAGASVDDVKAQANANANATESNGAAGDAVAEAKRAAAAGADAAAAPVSAPVPVPPVADSSSAGASDTDEEDAEMAHAITAVDRADEATAAARRRDVGRGAAATAADDSDADDDELTRSRRRVAELAAAAMAAAGNAPSRALQQRAMGADRKQPPSAAVAAAAARPIVIAPGTAAGSAAVPAGYAPHNKLLTHAPAATDVKHSTAPALKAAPAGLAPAPAAAAAGGGGGGGGSGFKMLDFSKPKPAPLPCWIALRLRDDHLASVFAFAEPYEMAARMSLVCRQWSAVARDELVWRVACDRFGWFATPKATAVSMRLLADEYGGSFRAMFVGRAHMRFDGYYLLETKMLQMGGMSLDGPRAKVVQIAYYRYFHFFADGRVLYALLNAPPKAGAPFRERDPALRCGRYRLVKDQLQIVVDVGHMMASMRLALESSSAGKHNRLVFTDFHGKTDVEPAPVRFPLPANAAKFFAAEYGQFSGKAEVQNSGHEFVG